MSPNNKECMDMLNKPGTEKQRIDENQYKSPQNGYGRPSDLQKELTDLLLQERKKTIEEALSKLPKGDRNEDTGDYVENQANCSYNQAIQESKEILEKML